MSSTVSLINSLVDISTVDRPPTWKTWRRGPGSRLEGSTSLPIARSSQMGDGTWAVRPGISTCSSRSKRSKTRLDSMFYFRCSRSARRCAASDCRQKTIAKSFAAVPLVMCWHFRPASSSQAAHICSDLFLWQIVTFWVQCSWNASRLDSLTCDWGPRNAWKPN